MTSLKDAIPYTFRNEALLTQALTHSSFANERRYQKEADYERLEFLGDAVLEMVSSAFLYERFPEKKEGELTKLRASLVCEEALAKAAAKLPVQENIRLGKGEESQGGRQKSSILSDVMESVIGAIYVDGGLEAAKTFILTFILDDVSGEEGRVFDAKSELQEAVQKRGLGAVRYALLKEEGPEHAKNFTCAVYIGGIESGTGEGKNKKTAEQHAALMALQALSDKD